MNVKSRTTKKLMSNRQLNQLIHNTDSLFIKTPPSKEWVKAAQIRPKMLFADQSRISFGQENQISNMSQIVDTSAMERHVSSMQAYNKSLLKKNSQDKARLASQIKREISQHSKDFQNLINQFASILNLKQQVELPYKQQLSCLKPNNNFLQTQSTRINQLSCSQSNMDEFYKCLGTLNLGLRQTYDHHMQCSRLHQNNMITQNQLFSSYLKRLIVILKGQCKLRGIQDLMQELQQQCFRVKEKRYEQWLDSSRRVLAESRKC